MEVEVRVQSFDAIKIMKTTLRTNKELHLRMITERVLQRGGRSVPAIVYKRNGCTT